MDIVTLQSQLDELNQKTDSLARAIKDLCDATEAIIKRLEIVERRTACKN